MKPAIKQAAEDVILMNQHRAYQQAVTDLFQNKRGGHLGAYVYVLPSDETNRKIFEGFQSAKSYYIKDEDIALIDTIKSELALSHKTFVDLGPGSAIAVETKALPIAKAIGAAQYTAIDTSEDFAQKAMETMEAKGLTSQAFVSDFMTKNLPAQFDDSLLFIAGLTILNAETSNDAADPYKHIRQTLQNLRTSCSDNCHLLVAIDCNQNFNELEAAYHHNGFAELASATLLNTPAIDIDISGFAFTTLWDEPSKRYAFGMISLANQTVTIGNTAVSVKRNTRFDVANCFKLPEEHFIEVARNAGWKFSKSWSHTGRIKYILLKAQ